MAKAISAKKSGVKTKTSKAAPKAKAPAAKKPVVKAKPAAAAKKAPAKKAAAKPVAKKPAAKKATAKKAPAKKPAVKKTEVKKAEPAAKPAAKAPAAKAKAAPKAKTAPKTAPKAAPASTLPAEGQKAPDFSLPADDGSTVSLADLAGKKIVLYFYPKDDTPGCTVEAIAFSAQKAAFEAANAVVLGVSKDSIKAHCKFRDKHNLTVRLLSDETGGMLEAYGVWVEKSQYGRTYMGIARTTFLIDEKGTVAKVWPKVKVDGHADDVLAAVKSL